MLAAANHNQGIGRDGPAVNRQVFFGVEPPDEAQGHEKQQGPFYEPE
jgi:hypothetical protein